MTSSRSSQLLADLNAFFNERLTELDEYIDFLDQLEVAARSGAPSFKRLRRSVSPVQQRILISGTYLQLYNLIEASVTKCLETLVEAVCIEKQSPANFNANLRREWIRASARTHIDLGADKRLAAAVEVCDTLISSLTVDMFEVQAGGGGNWDDKQIEAIFDRVGVTLKLKPSTRTAAKKHLKDDMGALKLVKHRRNQLAHGSISFVECSQTDTVSDVVEISKTIRRYLSEAIASIHSYVKNEL